MIIRRYDDVLATGGHNNSIRAYTAMPGDGDIRPPFGSAWGFLPGPGQLEPHAHPTQEVYMVFEGRGVVSIEDEDEQVGPGDIIEIPADARHSLRNDGPGPLLWVALWWAADASEDKL
jgi:mannose-6-phosphate isomerase-like protein (cupin superfamily)